MKQISVKCKMAKNKIESFISFILMHISHKRKLCVSHTFEFQVFCRLRPLDDPNEAVCAKPMNEKVVQLVPPDVRY